MAIYVQYQGISGDATQQDHKGWLDVDTLTWGVNRAMSTSAGRAQNREASEPDVHDFTLTRTIDKGSPLLFGEAVTGRQGRSVQIDLVTTGNPGQTYCTFLLDNVLVSAYSIQTSGDRPVEMVYLNSTKVQFKYIAYDTDNVAQSPVIATYDLATAKYS